MERNPGPRAAIQTRIARGSDRVALEAVWAELLEDYAALGVGVLAGEAGIRYWREVFGGTLAADHPTFRIWTAVRGERPVGFIMARLLERADFMEPKVCGYISMIAVLRECRRLGVGTLLLDEVLQWLRERGVSELELETYPKHEAARAFWQAHGFETVQVRMVRRLPKGERR